MKDTNIYETIGSRTGGDIYIGVVGPVRAGKSTFIKRFMDLMVIPNVHDTYERQRILDEMPQSGTGRTITTTEPKFIPTEGVRLELSGNTDLKVRLVDCVGYLVPGAKGHTEDGEPRMVVTPWSSQRLPFETAAEIGTEKVIRDHSTVGVVVTTDGSIGTMDREDYQEAEERVIKQLRELHKPFVVILNSVEPGSSYAKSTASRLSEDFDVPVVALDCARASQEEMENVLWEVLKRFPVKEIVFDVPGYVDGLDMDHWLKSELLANIRNWAVGFDTIDELNDAVGSLVDGQMIQGADVRQVDMATGRVELRLDMVQDLYYRIITELMGEPVDSDGRFFSLLKEFAEAKRSYDKIRGAIEQVDAGGYGIVEPKLEEMVLEEPEIYKQGNKYGVKITAKAPTLHIIKTDITTEVSPVVGSEKQSEELVASLKEDLANSPNGIWDTNFFGKSLYDMVAEQMNNKIAAMPGNVRIKMQRSLQKISDEGKEYFICIVI